VRSVDTNILVRLVARDDASQTAAAEAFAEHGAWVSHLVLMEAAWVLDSVYGLKSAEIAMWVRMLLDHRNLTLQDPALVEATLVRYRRKPSLGFSDCLILESARTAGHLPLGTFDHDLGGQDGAQRLKAGFRSRGGP
jgi:predicted nucleic-acid-binding protein